MVLIPINIRSEKISDENENAIERLANISSLEKGNKRPSITDGSKYNVKKRMKLTGAGGTIMTDDSNCSSDSSYDLAKDHNTSENLVYIDKLNKLIVSNITENDIFSDILNDKFVHEVQESMSLHPFRVCPLKIC